VFFVRRSQHTGVRAASLLWSPPRVLIPVRGILIQHFIVIGVFVRPAPPQLCDPRRRRCVHWQLLSPAVVVNVFAALARTDPPWLDKLECVVVEDPVGLNPPLPITSFGAPSVTLSPLVAAGPAATLAKSLDAVVTPLSLGFPLPWPCPRRGPLSPSQWFAIIPLNSAVIPSASVRVRPLPQKWPSTVSPHGAAAPAAALANSLDTDPILTAAAAWDAAAAAFAPSRARTIGVLPGAPAPVAGGPICSVGGEATGAAPFAVP
jgi:hypothetical protein